MGFRVSSSSSYLLFQRLLNEQSVKRDRIGEQMATGKKINRPSDDPESAKQIANLQQAMDRMTQYKKNLDAAGSAWRLIETTMDGMNSTFNRAREIALQANNGTMSAEQREVFANEVHQLAESLLAAGNTKINGEYIFSGFKTDTKPFVWDGSYPAANPAVTFVGDTNIKRIEIQEGQYFDTQMRGDTFFLNSDSDPNEVNLFQTLANLENALLTNNVEDSDPASVGQSIEDLDKALRQIQNEMAGLGAKTNRITNTQESVEQQYNLFHDFISEKQDIDLGEVAYEFSRAQTALQATVSSAAAVLNRRTLMDFLN